MTENAETHNNLGFAHIKSGQLGEAEASFRRALQIKPNYAKAHNNLGNILNQQGRISEAEASYRRALQINPDYAEAHNNLGNILNQQGRISEAEASYRRALQINPDYAEAHNSLGNVLRDLGQLGDAVDSYRRALQLKPDAVMFHSNLGNALRELGQLDNAVACCCRALQINPDYAEAHNNLGNALCDLGQLDAAVDSFRRTLEIKPDFAAGHSNLGLLLQEIGRHADGAASLRRSLQIKPDDATVYSNLLFCLSHCKDVDAQTLFAEHRRFGDQFELPLRANWPQHGNTRDPERRLRVGVVSGDLRSHAVANFIEPVVAQLSGYPSLSLHAYCNHAVEDGVSQHLRTHFVSWEAVVGLSDEALAQKIRADGIDILLDLSGHTAKNRLPAFARKPAPVQASWMGYPGTTGLMAMDYFLADRFFLPQGQFDDQFMEKIVRLPVGAPFLPDKNAPPVNALPALGNGYVTFGSFNRTCKISREVAALWSQLLRALPDSRMVLGGMSQDGKNDTLAGWFAREDIARERLNFYPRCGIDSYLALHHQVDICLDTFPYNGGTTTLHALWMGVPTLTLAGATAAGRPGASILGHVGLDAFVARDAADFVRKGVDCANNLASLSGIRAGLRERFAASAMGQPTVAAAGLEHALRIMWQRWCEGLPAESFDVPSPHETVTPQGAEMDLDDMLQQAAAHHQAGRLVEAEEIYHGLLRIEPGHPDANYNLGLLAMQLNQPEKGLSFLHVAWEADPSVGQYWLTLTECLLEMGHIEDARLIIEEAMARGLTSPQAQQLLARARGGSAPAAAPPADMPTEAPAHVADHPVVNETSPETPVLSPPAKAKPAVREKPAAHKKKNPSPLEMQKLEALFNKGRHQEAVALAQSMAERYPRHEFAWKMLGLLFQRMGRHADALASLQKVAALSPNDAEAQLKLGNLFSDLGKLDEAEACYRRALQIKPNIALAHNNLGATLQAIGRLGEAEACYRRALKINPNCAEAHNNLGNTLKDMGRLEEAIDCYQRALKIKPDIPDVHNNLGVTLKGMGWLDEAVACYKQALLLKPDFAEAYSNLGEALKIMGMVIEAETCCRRALEIRPNFAIAHNHLGNALMQQDRLGEAEASYRRALELKPDFALAHNNLGSTLRNQGRYGEAKASYRNAWQLGKKGARIQEALLLPSIMGTREEMLESRAEYERNLDELILDVAVLDDPLRDIGETNFFLAYHGLNDKDLQIKVAKFYEQVCPSLLYTAPHCLKPQTEYPKKIRVGFFSRYLYKHSVSLCFSKVIEKLSLKGRFEVALISDWTIDEEIYAGFVGERVRLPNNLERARKMLAELELDVLLYLDIGMEPLSYFLAFSRLARVQCVLGGHPVTTGITNMDYFVSTGLMEPVDAHEHYSEKLALLPRPMIYFARPQLPATLKTRAELGLPEERRIYMCPMKLQKIHPDFDEALTRILQLDRNGVVVLFEDHKFPAWEKDLVARFEKTIPAEVRERVLFLPWIKDTADLINAIAMADVILDPFHFGIGSTAIMVFATNTPLVTKPGEFMRGRVGAGLCEMLCLAECVAQDTESYAQKAVEIANDRILRDKISEKIRQNSHVLYDNQQPIEDFADFIESLNT